MRRRSLARKHPEAGAQQQGLAPVAATVQRVRRHDRKIDDIDVWELNEAHAAQFIRLGTDSDRLNINARSISLGHARMTGLRPAGQILIVGRPRKAVISMCVGDRMGARGLFEVVHGSDIHESRACAPPARHKLLNETWRFM
jgi:acetyl-CoA C-acetyltransferase